MVVGLEPERSSNASDRAHGAHRADSVRTAVSAGRNQRSPAITTLVGKALVGKALVGAALGMVFALGLTGCARPKTPVVEVAASTDAPAASSGAVDAAAPTVGPLPTVGPTEANATVMRVIDGDTIEVHLSAAGRNRREHVRLIGIDTPESKKPNTPVECFAKAASAGTESLLPSGTPVRLERDVEERDRYGRLLAYVFRASDGLFVNLELARAGYAAALTYPPNVAHTDAFLDAVAVARAAGIGLWGSCAGPHEPAS